MEIDGRRMRVTIELGDGSVVPTAGSPAVSGAVTKSYENVYISATGTKYSNSLQGEAKVTIGNLTKQDRDYLMTQTSPFNKTRRTKRLILEAGRDSTGLSKVFVGDIWRCTTSQPPDVMMTLECRTGQAIKQVVGATTQPSTAPLSKIASDVAGQMGLLLNNQATDKNIQNYAYSGPLLKQVNALNDIGVQAFVDGDTLVVLDKDKALPGSVRVLSETSGMIGIPEISEAGVRVKYLFDHTSRLGGLLRIQSRQVPAANGDYKIYKLDFELSNRAVPFYWIAEAARA